MILVPLGNGLGWFQPTIWPRSPTNTAPTNIEPPVVPLQRRWPPGALDGGTCPEENATAPPENLTTPPTWLDVTVVVVPPLVDCKPCVFT